MSSLYCVTRYYRDRSDPRSGMVVADALTFLQAKQRCEMARPAGADWFEDFQREMEIQVQLVSLEELLGCAS